MPVGIAMWRWRQAKPGRLASRKCKCVRAAAVSIGEGSQALGQSWPLSLRHLATGSSAGIKKGFDPYNVLYCDSRKWLQERLDGLLLTTTLLANQSAGIEFHHALEMVDATESKTPQYLARDGFWQICRKERPEEIVNQIKYYAAICKTRPGDIHWSLKCLLNDKGGLATTLEKGLYAEPAIIPASPWLERNAARQTQTDC